MTNKVKLGKILTYVYIYIYLELTHHEHTY